MNVTLSDDGVTTLFGVHDENLRLIEGAFGVRISARGNEIFVRGDESVTSTVGTTGWEKQTISGINFGTGYDLVIIGFKSNNYRTDLDFVGIDNVAVGPVPEPTSLALIGLGALCLVRRRRK